METKVTTRATALARRDALDAETRKRKSALICREVGRLIEEALAKGSGTGGKGAVVPINPNGGRAARVAVYAAMRSEVDLGALVDALCARGQHACFPCMVPDEEEGPARMVFYRVPAERLAHARKAFLSKPLRCHACDELEAAGYEAVAPEELDAVVVPLVAFDDAGRRLGYGGGNYDRLLARLRPDALVVGVAFDEQRVPAVPCEEHDMPLPRVVSA